MRVAAGQLASEPGDVGRNLATLVAATAAAGRAGARLLVLPEAVLTGYDDARFAELSLDEAALGSGLLDPLVAAAAADGVDVLAGAVLRRAHGTTIATVVVTAAGALAAYDKRFLDADERHAVTPGSGAATHDVDGVVVGLGTCHDLAFPEHAGDSAALGATVLAYGTVCPRGGARRQQVRAAARAVDTASHVVVAGAVGAAGRLHAAGGSLVVDADGVELGRLGDGPGLLLVDLDTRRPAAARAERPLDVDRGWAARSCR